MNQLVGKRVKAESGAEGLVVAVGTAGDNLHNAWTLLIMKEDGQLITATALNARVQLPEPTAAVL